MKSRKIQRRTKVARDFILCGAGEDHEKIKGKGRRG